jgi:glycosyltransferase (activator-dependent family)
VRVLFVTYPEKIVFLGMVPLAWSLRTAGHEVCVASQPGLNGVITEAGLPALPVGRDHGLWRILRMRPDELAAARIGFPKPYDVVDVPKKRTWTYLTKGYDFAVTWWHKMENVPMVTDLVAFARKWQPDLVIWEPTTFAGAIAAKAVGAAHARLTWGMDVFSLTRDHYLRLKADRPGGAGEDPLAEWLGGQAERFGSAFSEDMVTGHFTIDQLPRPLRTESPNARYVPLRYTPYGGRATVPDWLREPPPRPRVVLTLGLSATDTFGGYLVDVAGILHALADLDVEVVATIAEAARESIGALPANVRAVPYVPLHALVPTAAAVIHHAGFGTLATTTLHGIPQLALPVHFDEPHLARALADAGAGLTIPSAEATGAAVRQQVVRLLEDPALAAGAARLRDQMTAMPSPNELVGELETLAGTYRAR